MALSTELRTRPRGDLYAPSVQISMTVVAHAQIVCLSFEHIHTNSTHARSREGYVAILAHVRAAYPLLDVEVDRVLHEAHHLDIGGRDRVHLGMTANAVSSTSSALRTSWWWHS
jgi:hypothetical protein